MTALVRVPGVLLTLTVAFFVATGTPTSFADTALGSGALSVGGGGVTEAFAPSIAGQEDGVLVSGSWSYPGELTQAEGRQVQDSFGLVIRPPAQQLLGSGLLSCDATASAGAVATGITSCYVVAPDGRVFSASPQAAPGPLDAVATASFAANSSSYQVCFQAEALFADGTYVQTELRCF